MKIKITTHALRCIDKKGGLDNYLLFTRDKAIDSKFGINLKQQLKQAYEEKEGKKFNLKKEVARMRQLRIKEK